MNRHKIVMKERGGYFTKRLTEVIPFDYDELARRQFRGSELQLMRTSSKSLFKRTQ